MPPPTSSDTLDILLAHNHWAMRKVLDVSRTLTHEQFHRSFPIGPASDGGLHALLTHTVGTIGRWADRISGRPLRTMISKPFPGYEQANNFRERTPDELIAILDESCADLAQVAAAARKQGLETTITLDFTSPKGTTRYTFTRGAALAHVLTHGIHHRAQCLNILRQLGVPNPSDNPGDISVVDWQHETECIG